MRPIRIPFDICFSERVEIMDLYSSGFLFPGDPSRNENFSDTALRLDCLGYGSRSTARSGNSQSSNRELSAEIPDDGCRLVLGLGPTSCLYADDYFAIGFNRSQQSPTVCSQGLMSEGDSGILKLGLSRGSAEHVGLYESSVSGHGSLSSSHLYTNESRLLIPVVDEGSISAKKSGSYIPSLLLAPRLDTSKDLLKTRGLSEIKTNIQYHNQPLVSPSEPSATTDFSSGTMYEPGTGRASSDQRNHHPKMCKVEGCSKGARGASGLCISHGGGQRCQRPSCNKGAESRTAYCKAHGGGKRCQHLGCTKSAEGKTEYCIAHGGGKRCGYTDCSKAARGRSSLCIRHGGGKRCKVEACTRSAEDQAGLCISHGGGRRCQYPGCNKGAQGSTMHCKAHGGGKRCIFAGCTKGAEGSTSLCKGHGGGKRCLFGGGVCPKSVHGGTDYCVAHGGGKRCDVPGCTKSARGRTDCCVRHGGGKRCRFESCGKSAQGSTDFCKAHGGGKRCTWGQGMCEKFARGKIGLCAAHASMVQGKESNKSNMIGAGLFHGLASGPTFGSSFDNDCSSSGVSVVSDCIDSAEKPTRKHHLIPPQLLVPLSMKTTSSGPLSTEREERGGGGSLSRRFNFLIPEGRVHGGGLMSLLGGDLKNATVDGI